MALHMHGRLHTRALRHLLLRRLHTEWHTLLRSLHWWLRTRSHMRLLTTLHLGLWRILRSSHRRLLWWRHALLPVRLIRLLHYGLLGLLPRLSLWLERRLHARLSLLLERRLPGLPLWLELLLHARLALAERRLHAWLSLLLERRLHAAHPHVLTTARCTGLLSEKHTFGHSGHARSLHSLRHKGRAFMSARFAGFTLFAFDRSFCLVSLCAGFLFRFHNQEDYHHNDNAEHNSEKRPQVGREHIEE